MKKVIVLGSTILATCVLLTGCHLKHEWQEATCTAPKTCTIGGETEGEPLGHTWVDATCTEPKTCSVCGETEGEPLGHGTLTEANYQQGPVCTVCGESTGEPLEADFEKHDLVYNTEFDTPYTYQTVCYDDTSLTTIGTVTYSDYLLTDSFEFFEVPEGYVVQAVTATYDFSDENAQGYGSLMARSWEDYYDIVGHDDSFERNDDDVATYTVSFNGKDYTECQSYYFTTRYGSNWIERTYFCVPEGYDGTVLTAVDAGISWEDGMYIYDVADENIVFFRLPAASGEMGGAASTDSFEDHGLAINTEEGVTYDYITSCLEDTSKKTLGHLTFSDYQIIGNDAELENIEGYEWRKVHATITCDDENAWKYAINAAFDCADYYNIKKTEDLWFWNSEGMKRFTVNYNGTEYTRCAYFYNAKFSDWVNHVCTFEGDFYVRVPIGYDGAVIYFFDSSNVENYTYPYEKADENTLFFRMD